MFKVKVSQIALFLNTSYEGKDIILNGISSLNNIKERTLVFSKKNSFEIIDKRVLIIVPLDFKYDISSSYSIIKVKNTRLVFAKIATYFFIKKVNKGIADSTLIGTNVKISKSVSIGNNCTIGDNVYIGENTIINNNVVISDNTIIGNNCYIKSGVILGEDGFGFDFEEDGIPVRIPHIGNLVIGNNVEIGSTSVIVRGTLDNTYIADNVKIDDKVFIAHNCSIGENSIIIAFAEISGSVNIGKNCWIGPNCSIIQKVVIGDNVTIGIGAIITKDIDSNKKVMGLESLTLKELVKFKKGTKYGRK